MSQQTVRSDDLTIGELFKDFFVVPTYQREYVWQEENVQQLLDDVIGAFHPADPSESSEYFLGSIVVCAQSDNVWELIDGQQRMTTCYLVLCALRDRLQELEPQKAMDALRGQISSTTTDPSTGEDIHLHRVELQYEDSGDVLKRIADADDVERADNTISITNIWTAYETVKSFLRSQFGSAADVRKFYAHFTSHVKLIRVRTASVSHALRVFETINDRGVGLDAMDLLKNLMFIHADTEDYEALKAGWKKLVDTLHQAKEKPLRFLRYYILADHDVDRLKEEEIYEWFKVNKLKCGYESAPVAFVQRLNEAATIYARLLDGQSPQGKHDRHLANIRLLSGVARQHFIALLAARKIPVDCFAEVTRVLEQVLFSFIITREPANTLERLFAAAAPDLRGVKNRTDLDAVLQRRFAPERKRLAGRFALAFSTLTQHDLQKYRLRYVLAKLTQYLNELAWGSSSPHDDLSTYLNPRIDVEHILPQTPSAEVLSTFDKPGDWTAYVGRLGNLALLEKSINASIGNGTLAAKKLAYSQSSFVLTKSIAERPVVGKNTAFDRAIALLTPATTWTSRAIEDRQERLKSFAHEVWDMPSADAEVTQT